MYRKISRYYYNFKFEIDEMNEFDQLDELNTKKNFTKKKISQQRKNSLFR